MKKIIAFILAYMIIGIAVSALMHLIFKRSPFQSAWDGAIVIVAAFAVEMIRSSIKKRKST